MISLLVVNYRSADLTAEAIRSARESTSEKLHVVVVDNSCDASEVDQLRPHADVMIASRSNLGYAGAINLGRPSCRGEVAIISNPDVVYFPGAIDYLAAALADRVAVAGPALFWDDARQWVLPPADDQTLSGKVGEVMASRATFWRTRRDRRRFRARLHFWSVSDTTSVRVLSGAVMAVRLADFDAVGGFDERFPLYFEENDFLRRIRRAGRQIAYVPAAQCRHLYNQSAGGRAQEHASTAYAASERAYFSKWYGAPIARALKALERTPPVVEAPGCNGPWRLPRLDAVVEASPLRTFSTAAGHFPTSESVDLPPEVWRAYKSDVVYLRAVDPASARVLATCARFRGVD